MKRVQVVTESHAINDDKTRLEILERSDVLAIVKEQLEPVRKLVDRRSEELHSHVDRRCAETRAEVDRHIEYGLSALKRSFAENFVNSCGDDLREYFRQLGDWAKKIDRELRELENMRKTLESNLKTVTALAEYFRAMEKVKCPFCGSINLVDASFLGLHIKCRQCGKKFPTQ